MAKVIGNQVINTLTPKGYLNTFQFPIFVFFHQKLWPKNNGLDEQVGLKVENMTKNDVILRGLP